MFPVADVATGEISDDDKLRCVIGVDGLIGSKESLEAVFCLFLFDGLGELIVDGTMNGGRDLYMIFL